VYSTGLPTLENSIFCWPDFFFDFLIFHLQHISRDIMWVERYRWLCHCTSGLVFLVVIQANMSATRTIRANKKHCRKVCLGRCLILISSSALSLVKGKYAFRLSTYFFLCTHLHIMHHLPCRGSALSFDSFPFLLKLTWTFTVKTVKKSRVDSCFVQNGAGMVKFWFSSRLCTPVRVPFCLKVIAMTYVNVVNVTNRTS
jgi:hypothetical protein